MIGGNGRDGERFDGGAVEEPPRPDSTAVYLGLGDWIRQARAEGGELDDVFWSLLMWAMNIHASVAEMEGYDREHDRIRDILTKMLAGDTPPIGKPVKLN